MSKTFSQYASEKIADIFANQSNHVGNQLKPADPIKYKNHIASDCIVSYYNQVKKSCTYSVTRVPVSHALVNYSPSAEKVTPYLGLTTKTTTDYNAFKRVPFGLGMSRGGMHVWLYSREKVYESHWENEPNNDLYTATQLNKFEWLSGIIVVPPDSHHLLKITTTKCN